MVENEKVFERIKELVTAYNGEKDFLVSAAAEIGIDPFRYCLGSATLELQRLVRKNNKGDVVIILRDVDIQKSDGLYTAQIYMGEGIWDKIYGEEECTTE